MTKTKKTVAILVAILLVATLALTLINHNKSSGSDMLPITLKPVKTEVGWGYEIAVDGKLFIRQLNVPAVQGNIAFSSKQDALIVGRHAVEKLRRGHMPDISEAELKQWRIIKNS